MLRITSDQIGDLGELIAAADLSRPVIARYRRPLFRPVFLGGKYPDVDYIVDVLGNRGERLGVFFVQVRSTSRAGTTSISVPHWRRLLRSPVPTYVVAVDLGSESSYVSAAKKNARRAGKKYNLRSDQVRINLYEEVVAFWKHVPKDAWRTSFAT